MKHILVISGDILPYPGFPTTGAGLRAWSIGQGLASQGHTVTFAMPRSALDKERALPVEHPPLLFQHQDLPDFIRQQQADVVVLQHWGLATYLPESPDMPLVIDFHGPLLLETQFQENPALEPLKHKKIAALHKADFFTCAGEKQRFYFEAWLLLAGFDLRQPVIVSVPVALSPELPEHQSAGELSFVYGGVFLPWQDPVLGLTTLTECLEQHRTGLLKFFGGKHPVVAVPTAGFERLRLQLQQSPRVRLQPMIPRDQLIEEYCRAHVAIDVMQRNAERELAFTTRTVEYLWCGLPVIYNNYSELTEYIWEYQAGWIVDPADKDALVEVIESILNNPDDVAERSGNAQRLVQECLTWDQAIAPLDAFCRNPHKRGKGDALADSSMSVFAQAKYYEEKLFYHLKHEGPTGVAKRLWNKVRP